MVPSIVCVYFYSRGPDSFREIGVSFSLELLKMSMCEYGTNITEFEFFFWWVKFFGLIFGRVLVEDSGEAWGEKKKSFLNVPLT